MLEKNKETSFSIKSSRCHLCDVNSRGGSMVTHTLRKNIFWFFRLVNLMPLERDLLDLLAMESVSGAELQEITSKTRSFFVDWI